MVKKSYYATTLEQIKDDRFQTNDWTNLKDAVGGTNLSASSTYRKKDNVNFIPAQLYAHDFKIELPDQYIINNVQVEVKLKGTVDVQVPRCYFYYDGTIGHIGASYSSNIYSDQPNKNIASSFTTPTYTMNWSQVTQYRLNKQRIESDLFGVILQFNEPTVKTNGTVSVEWIKVTVEYEEPEYRIEIAGILCDRAFEAQYMCKKSHGSLVDVTIKVHSVNGHITPSPKTVQIDIPLGLHLNHYVEGYGVSFNPNTHELYIDWSEGVSPYLKLTLWCRYAGLKKISVIGDNDIGSLSKYLFVDKGYYLDADEDVLITSGEVRRWEYSDFHFVVKTINADGTADFTIDLDKNRRGTANNHLVECKLDTSLSSEGVSLIENAIQNDYVSFNVPPGEEVEIHFTCTYLPLRSGNFSLRLEANDSANIYYYDYTSAEPYDYIAEVLNHDIKWTGGRLVSQIQTGAYVYPVGVHDLDCNLVQDKSTLVMSKWDDIDYIGCVPLEQTHFDPKSTYKDTLLDTSYKNKKYMGKKGVVDETISLNVRLHPPQVTTIQGLIGMDKPVPINTNHLAFEGDSLNHRGWAELYGITTDNTGNNPHWYKCQLSVKYITHNLNTRFSINKGSRISDYFLPELMTTVHEYGDDLGDNFYVETNGGYIYSRSATDYHMRTMLSLPSGKRFKINGMERLSIKSQVNFNWYSTRNTSNVQNNMSRIIRLVDAETNNAVLEYEYYDVDFSRTYEYTCRVICRVLHKGAYKTILNRNLVLNYDSEYNPTEAEGMPVYGSELIFKINNDKVTIQDTGMSGKELYIEDIDIQNGQYFFDVEFTNLNDMNDLQAPDINNFVDIQMQELDYTSLYSNYYKNILVSPFAVPGKDIVFTRDSEEGTIFYLLDDGTECSYMVNPYYQYHCGVDLQSRDGISIFNLDNNYKTVYIVNGLVKIGINRYNGRATIYKYDKYHKEYVLVTNMQFVKYDDININSFTDDKLEMQVSDTVITMWRGRPYIHFAHETEDILFTDKFTKVYADGVGSKSSNMTQLWNLVDTTNLLPVCVASEKLLDSSCWYIESSNISNWDDSLVSVYVGVNGGLATETSLFADYSGDWDSMHFIIDGYYFEGSTEGPFPEPGTHYTNYQFTSTGIHKVRAVYYYGTEYHISPEINVEIEDNAYQITPLFPSTMYYMQNDFTAKLTYCGVPQVGETITFYVNGLSYPKETNAEGIATLNNRLPPNDEDDPDDKYKVYMNYYENELLATARKDTKVMRGAVNIAIKGYDKNGNAVEGSNKVKQHGYVNVRFTNNLDSNDDDIDPSDIYLKNKQVMLSINGREYPRITDNNGRVRLNINLLPQNYDLNVSFSGDGQYKGTVKSFELTVLEDS